MSSTGGFDSPDPVGPADSAGTLDSARLAGSDGRSGGQLTLGRRTWVIALVVVAIVASAGAGFAAGTMVGGGGTQPEDVLPDTVLAYADIDLDPAAQQKLNLVRLLGRFPDVEQQYGNEPDLRTVVIDALVEGTDLQGAQVDAWIGDRVGVGISWDADSGSVTPVAAIEVTDEDEALADLGEAFAADQIATSDGYVVVTGDLMSAFAGLGQLNGLTGDASAEPQTAAEIVSTGKDAPLSQAVSFTSVFDRLDEGMFTVYFDGEQLAAIGQRLVDSLGLFGTGLTNSLADLGNSGQSGAVLRAEPNALELQAWTSAPPINGDTPVQLTPTLPESTLLAVESTGGSDALTDRWAAALEQAEQNEAKPGEVARRLAQIEAQFGLTFPDDLQTLVGDDVALAVDGEGLLTSVPGIGLRSVTDPEAGAVLASKIESALASVTGGFGIRARGTTDGMVVASTDEYATQLEAADGALGADPTFENALPDAAQATSLIWLDFSAVRGFVALTAPQEAGVVNPLQALGVTVRPDDGGQLARVRLVFDGATDS